MVVLLKAWVVVEVDVEVCVLEGEVVLLPRASAMVSEATLLVSESMLMGAGEALLPSVETEGSDGDEVGDTSIVASTPGVTVIVVVMVVTSVTLVVVVVVVPYCSKDGLLSKWAC